jgi:5,6-dimethylbenzimidazole synthase
VPGPHFDEEFRRQLFELIRWRRDVRRFRTDPISPGVVDELLAAAALAPSVGNSQPWRFVKVDDPARRAKVRASFLSSNEAALAGYRGERALLYASLKLAGLDQAPVHLAVLVDPDPAEGGGLGRKTMPETVPYSAVLAIHTLWLVARARGIGLGWVSILDPALVHRALDVDPSWSFVAYLCLGMPEEEQLDPELERAGWQSRVSPSSFVLQR